MCWKSPAHSAACIPVVSSETIKESKPAQPALDRQTEAGDRGLDLMEAVTGVRVVPSLDVELGENRTVPTSALGVRGHRVQGPPWLLRWQQAAYQHHIAFYGLLLKSEAQTPSEFSENLSAALSPSADGHHLTPSASPALAGPPSSWADYNEPILRVREGSVSLLGSPLFLVIYLL